MDPEQALEDLEDTQAYPNIPCSVVEAAVEYICTVRPDLCDRAKTACANRGCNCVPE